MSLDIRNTHDRLYEMAKANNFLPCQLQYFLSYQYDDYQLEEIEKGFLHQLGYKVSVYANPIFSWEDMECMRESLEEGLSIEEVGLKAYLESENRSLKKKELHKARESIEKEAMPSQSYTFSL